MVSLWSQVMFRYECKQKVQCWGFQTLALLQNLCMQKHNTVQYMRGGQLLLIQLPLSGCIPPWVFMLVGSSGDLKKHKHLHSQDWSSHIHPNDQKGSKEFVMVTSWVHPCLLSTLEMASGTHSIPALGLTRQMHARQRLFPFIPISRPCPCNDNSCPNPTSRRQPSYFLGFH